MRLDRIPARQGGKKMINEEATFLRFGYYSTELSPKSGKKIVAVCDGCGKVRIPSKADYHALCPSCAQKGERNPNFSKKGANSSNWKGGLVMRICEECEIEFPAFPSATKRGRGRFCSPKCQGRWWSKIQKGKSMAHLRAKQHQKPSKPERIFQEICQKNNIPFHYVGDGQLWIGKRKKMNPDFIEANGKKICVEIMGAWWHSRLLNQKVREDALLPYREKHYKHYKWQPIFIWDSDLLRKDAETFVLNELRKEGI